MDRSRIAWVLAAVAVVALHVTHPEGVIGELTYLLGTCGAAFVAWLGSRRSDHRGVPSLITLGVGLSALADVLYQVITWVGHAEPMASPADIAWIGSYLAIGLAMMQLLRRGPRGTAVDGLIDVGAVFILLMLLQWEPVLRELIDDATASVGIRVLWLAYPTLDAMLLALVLRLVITRQIRMGAPLTLAAGAACWFASDQAFSVLGGVGSLAAWVDAGWIVGAMFLAASAWLFTDVELEPDSTPHDLGYGRLAIGVVPLGLPAVIQVAAHVRGEAINPIPLAGATGMLTVLAFIRGARLLATSRAARESLASQERYASRVAAYSSDAVVLLSADGRILNEAPGLGALFGYPDAVVRGAHTRDVRELAGLDEVRTAIQRSLGLPGEVLVAEAQVGHQAGHDVWLQVRIVNLLDHSDVGGILVLLHDITDRKLADAALAHQAFHDVLTGLANRALFTDRVEVACRRSARTGRDPAVLFLDLDGFKTVNDSLGHGAGDELLRHVAARLEIAIRSSDTVARLGGDEFAILIEESDEPVAEASVVADRILDALAAPLTIGDQVITVSGSIGIAAGDATATATTLLRDADIAMYRAKTSGKGRWVVYDPDMRIQALERLQLETDLAGAVDNDQFRLVYQPVVELETDKVVGFEALLRWDHPSLGLVAPDKFIPIAEENGLIIPIGAWVLTEACRAAARWQQQFPDHEGLTIAINISARQIASEELLVHVAEAIATSGIEPTLVVLEMTETTLIADPEAAAARLRELRGLGVRLAIDDFGTGYSSLSYLRQFPVDILKIDRSFINSINDRDHIPAIVRGLLDLGRTLQLETVAEGVELDVQREHLRDEHCEYAQGYLFARPLDMSDVEILLLGSIDTDVATRSR